MSCGANAGSRLDVSQILLFRLNVYCHVGRLYTVALLCNISLETHQFKEKVICCVNSFPVFSPPPPETRPIGGEKTWEGKLIEVASL